MTRSGIVQRCAAWAAGRSRLISQVSRIRLIFDRPRLYDALFALADESRFHRRHQLLVVLGPLQRGLEVDAGSAPRPPRDRPPCRRRSVTISLCRSMSAPSFCKVDLPQHRAVACGGGRGIHQDQVRHAGRVAKRVFEREHRAPRVPEQRRSIPVGSAASPCRDRRRRTRA